MSIEFLINAMEDVDEQDDEGNTALHWAAGDGKTEIVKRLLKRGANPSIKCEVGYTPLHWAVWNGNIEIVKMLLNAGAELSIKDREGYTALEWAKFEGYTHLVPLLENQAVDEYCRDRINRRKMKAMESVVESLKEHDLKGVEGHELESLFCAVLNGDEETVRSSLFTESGDATSDLDLSATDRYGDSFLHFAAKYGYTDIVELFLHAGADKDVKGLCHVSPIEYAARFGHLDIVELLLDAGAKKESRNSYEVTPLHWAAYAWLKNPIYINIVRLLLNAGADKDVKDKNGKTPLNYAEEAGNKVIVNILSPE